MHEGKSFVKEKKWSVIRIAALVISLTCALVVLASNVSAQNTFIITDGTNVKTHITYATDPAEVLNEAGFELDLDDTYTTQSSNGIFEITVQRSQTITVIYGGETIEVNTYAQTVDNLLSLLDIEVNSNTRLSVDPDTITYDGMTITVTRIVRVTENYTSVIPYETTYHYDDTLPAGTEKVLIAGSEGQMLCSASVVYEEGREVSRTVLSQTVVEQPVNQVIVIGTGEEVSDAVTEGQLIIGDGYIITPEGEYLTYTSSTVMQATAYTHTDAGCDYWTATGTYVHIGTVAVDPRVIPYGTRMYIVSNDGKCIYGISTAEDCGGDIKNQRVDLYYPTYEECIQFGRRDVTIYFLG